MYKLFSCLEFKKVKVTEMFPKTKFSTYDGQLGLTSVFEMGTGVAQSCMNLLQIVNENCFINIFIERLCPEIQFD